MDRKRKRSSSGWRSFSASSRTLRLKCSQDSSRLKNRLGPNESTPALASSGCSCSGKVMNNLVNFASSGRLSAPRAWMLPWHCITCVTAMANRPSLLLRRNLSPQHLRHELTADLAAGAEGRPVYCRDHDRRSGKRPLDAQRERLE